MNEVATFGKLTFLALEIARNFLFRKDETFQLLMKDGFKVIDWNLVPAGMADVFRTVRWHIHFCAAVAEDHTREEIDHLLGGWLPGTSLLGHDGRALIPERHVHDGLHFGIYPVAFGLERPVFGAITSLGIVGAMQPLGRRIEDEAGHRGIGKLRTITCPMTALI